VKAFTFGIVLWRRSESEFCCFVCGQHALFGFVVHTIQVCVRIIGCRTYSTRKGGLPRELANTITTVNVDKQTGAATEIIVRTDRRRRHPSAQHPRGLMGPSTKVR
jgi:hypothetical protein